jgi:hypothetical protein
MARSLGKVVNFLIKEVIPPSEKGLIEELNHIIHLMRYDPPETQWKNWGAVGNTLYTWLGCAGDCEWKLRVARIMRDEEKIPD